MNSNALLKFLNKLWQFFDLALKLLEIWSGLKISHREKDWKSSRLRFRSWTLLISGSFSCPGIGSPSLLHQNKQIEYIFPLKFSMKFFEVLREILAHCWTHTWYLSRAPRACSCKFFLAGVNFYSLTQKIGNLLCILP